MESFVGCAGWSIPKQNAPLFETEGSHLVRYASRLRCVEINSSFYKPHRTSTYERWAASTPDAFRFAVKAPKQITHVHRLCDVEPLVEAFGQEIAGLGDKLGPVLVQLPPSLAFDASACEAFFPMLRAYAQADVVCEPRHRSWFDADVDAALTAWHVARVAADPSVVPQAALPGGDRRLEYYRWHGSPVTYYSNYSGEALADLTLRISESAAAGRSVWCIFDNTAQGAAQPNALEVTELLARGTLGRSAAHVQ